MSSKKYHIKPFKELITDIHLKEKYKRIFKYVLTNRERDKIIEELHYFSAIHYDTPPTILINCLINKYVKIKLHSIQYSNLKNSINEYFEYRYSFFI